MNREELKAELDRLVVQRDAYQIDGDANASEAYVLRPATWEVYYAERGEKKGQKVFASEREACEYLLLRLATDPTAQRS